MRDPMEIFKFSYYSIMNMTALLYPYSTSQLDDGVFGGTQGTLK
jgi:hypothetical protein